MATSAEGNMKRNKVFIAVMGVTGAGKSSLIKTITDNENIVVGHGLTSCTPSVWPYHFMHEGVEIVLIDTPGFNDTFRSETEVLKEIASWLEKTYRTSEIKLSGILYLHALEERRMGGTSLRSLKMFRQLCGESSMKNVIMVSTGWGIYRRDGRLKAAEDKEQELITKKEFWQGMIEKEAQTARFEDTKESALEIIMRLVPRMPTVLQIQHELVDEDLPLADTAAGVTVNEELAKIQAMYKKQLDEIRNDMDEALQAKDKRWQAELDEERAKLESMRDEARRAQDSLRYAQRNAQRQHESDLQDLRLALEKSREEVQAGSEQARQAQIKADAERIAEKMHFEEIIAKLEANMKNLRKEEREAIEEEIKKAKKSKDNKKRAVKLLCNILGIAGTVTMSALGLGFINPFAGLISFGSDNSGGGLFS